MKTYKQGVEDGITIASKQFKQGRGAWHIAHSCIPKRQYFNTLKEFENLRFELADLQLKCGILRKLVKGKFQKACLTIFEEFKLYAGRRYEPNVKEM